LWAEAAEFEMGEAAEKECRCAVVLCRAGILCGIVEIECKTEKAGE